MVRGFANTPLGAEIERRRQIAFYERLLARLEAQGMSGDSPLRRAITRKLAELKRPGRGKRLPVEA